MSAMGLHGEVAVGCVTGKGPNGLPKEVVDALCMSLAILSVSPSAQGLAVSSVRGGVRAEAKIPHDQMRNFC